ncbi:YggT family protein [Demequina capsici]|uniref:YggT family protein n=1 Tax=Demequina capsici TaxID=3075620 RepID=A0AA96J9B2_9MICO|nr:MULTISPECIES: YggT family protein [unclassified Demequina]WNM23341.1 YggT family protein [Demequina sp. OYTSA14]WNM26218.1 YggT family protein [Demequina sp. PMTSA13]
MSIIFQALYFVVFLFLLFLLGRVVLSWVQMFARDWRPSGASLVIVESIYSVTDPPIRVLRSIIPPITIGQIRFDLAVIILFFACYILMAVFQGLS